LASSAWRDGWGRNNALARKLAKPGVDADKVTNAARDIVSAAKEAGIGSTSAQPYFVDLPHNKGQLGILLPHETFADMVAQGGRPEKWCLRAEDRDTPLWRLREQWCSHPEVQIAGDAVSRVALIGLHADGVSYSSSIRAGEQKKVIVCCINVISAMEDGLSLKRQPCFVIQSSRLCPCGCSGYHTYQKLFDVVSWSFQCLAEGVAPTRRHDTNAWTEHDAKARMRGGTPLPLAGLVQVRGDWEWLAMCFRLRWYTAETFCWMCGTSSHEDEPEYFGQFAPDAPHRGTLLSHGDYLRSCAREGMQPANILKCPGMSIDYLVVDSMHASDLGCFADAVGGLFWCEVTCKAWHRNQLNGLLHLNAELKNYYSANKTLGLSSLYPLSLSQLKGEGGRPVLKAKAAQCRHVADFCLQLAYKHKHGTEHRPAFSFRGRLSGREQEHLDLMIEMFHGLVDYHRSCSAEVFSEDDCRDAMYRFLRALAGLHVLWREGVVGTKERNAMPFPLRPKAHLLQHLVEEKIQIWGSPSSFWCYKDEDFIGTVKTICVKSSHPSTIEARVLEKLVILEGLAAGC
jgi:hypothetical protein